MSNKSVTYWANRKDNKSGKPVRWERLLMVLGNGGLVTLKEIENTMEYRAMNRISAEIVTLKYNGGVIKTHKDGRNVVGYELVNFKEMVDTKLTPRGFAVKPIVGRDVGVKNLSDLNAKPAKSVKAPVIEDEGTEITE